MTVPYVFYKNGPILSTVLVIATGMLSYYTGYLLSYAAAMTGGKSMEEIAMKLFGVRALTITSICNLSSNIGFTLTYVILFKTTMPRTLVLCGLSPPDWLGGDDGK